MKANIYRGVRDIEFTELPMPEYGPKDALIRVTRAGICGTDLPDLGHGVRLFGMPGL